MLTGMTRYLVRRLIYSLTAVLVSACVIFVLLNVCGGDPVARMLGPHATSTLLAEIRQEYGLDRALQWQFLDYLRQIVTFDFGYSYASRESIGQMIRRGAGPSLTLTLPAFLLTAAVAYLLAMVAARFHRRPVDRFITGVCVLLMGVPALVWVIVGQYIFAFKLGWFPVSGFDRTWPDRLGFVLLPVLIWVMAGIGYDVRVFRNAILDQWSGAYVRMAQAKGLSEWQVLFRHVSKNSLPAVLSHLVISIPFLILGSFLLERFFAIPGLGNMTIEAIQNSDYPVVRAMTTIHSVLFIVGAFVTDVLYAWADPRVTLR